MSILARTRTIMNQQSERVLVKTDRKVNPVLPALKGFKGILIFKALEDLDQRQRSGNKYNLE